LKRKFDVVTGLCVPCYLS